MGQPARSGARPQPARARAAPARALPPADRRRGRLPAARTPGRQPALRARLAPLRARLDHHHQQPRLRAMGRDPRRHDRRRRPDRPPRPPRHHDHAQRQELPPPRARPRRRTSRSDSAAPRLRLSGGSPGSEQNRCLRARGSVNRRHRSAAHALRPPRPTAEPASAGALFDCGNWCTFRLRLTPDPALIASTITQTIAVLPAVVR